MSLSRLSRPARRTGVVLSSCSLALMIGCASGPVARGRVAGLERVVAQAEKNGAKKCAPRELALAKSYLEFAAVDLDQGEMSNAQAHLDLAEPNARAALAESPAAKCQEFAVEAKPGDRDGDGIPDGDDACPDEPETYNGYDDNDGCPDDPDTDKDLVPDSKDACPLEPEDKDGYLDDDGCPDTDNDADGIADTADKCPDKPEDFDGWQDEDGCPDPDNDGDTVPDLEDMCPNTPGPTGGDRPGCPKKNQLVIVTANEIRITQQIRFEFNKAIIKGADSFKILDAVNQVLKDNPKISLEIQGHTDNVGNTGYNQKLSQDRADAVRKYLTSHGTAAARLTSKGYGATQPIVPNTTEVNRALNRRVQFIRTESKP
jgi:outer membrane protein OmpA-like peptidoglycan-associated protein